MLEEFGGRWHEVLTGRAAECARAPGVPVIALHCSGADRRQWTKLGAALGSGFDLAAMECYGCGRTAAWCGKGPFTLAEEVRPVVELIDWLGSPVHLVGHSYGGGLALRAAIERPEAVASLVLYEPSAFHVLGELGPRGFAAREEVIGIARAISQGLVSGDYHAAAGRFVDYWNGTGAWAALNADVQGALLRWLPKAPLDFRALLCERTPLAAYGRLGVPALILCGEHAREPSRLIAQSLAHVMRGARLQEIAGAGHMGPFTHAAEVNAAIVAHLRGAVAAGGTAQARDERAPLPTGALAA